MIRKRQEIVSITATSAGASQTFKVYKETLCYYSEFFSAAFNGPFLEGQSQSMTLENVDPAVF
jgi:BTB/POZ domain